MKLYINREEIHDAINEYLERRGFKVTGGAAQIKLSYDIKAGYYAEMPIDNPGQKADASQGPYR